MAARPSKTPYGSLFGHLRLWRGLTKYSTRLLRIRSTRFPLIIYIFSTHYEFTTTVVFFPPPFTLPVVAAYNEDIKKTTSTTSNRVEAKKKRDENKVNRSEDAG